MPWFPSTQALRALESFSRHGTVWQAAEELNLTRSAVSHQLRVLERELNFTMFNQVGTRIELTPRGLAYAKDVRQALSIISSSRQRLDGDEISGAISVSCPPGLAASWLSMKIGHFCAKYPDISLSIVTPQRLEDVSNPNVDLFITYGDGKFEGMNVELLRNIHFTPLCSPVLLNKKDVISSPLDLLNYNFLHLFDHTDWSNWYDAAGQAHADVSSGVVFSDMNLVYAAALNAQGIALGDEFTCHLALASGQLVRPFDLSIEAPGAYYVVTSPQKANIPAIDAFKNWLFDEFRSVPIDSD